MIVIKIGGGKEINYDFVLKDFLNHQDAILVHGGNYEMKVVSEKLNVPVKMITSASGISSRRTDRETMNIFQMVYCGKMNKMIVEKLQQNGVNAIGLSGMDGRIVEGKRKDAIIIVEEGKRKVLRDDLSGKPEKVNTDLLKMLLKNKYVPVLCPPAISHDNMP
ncbi:[LysW]-aminoadipate kinase, partial [Candidatus Woesearchaeota archaeon]|nr:[LysW]-aminoadipate kinase [Candidatus Woesearchaeota archaeon]